MNQGSSNYYQANEKFIFTCIKIILCLMVLCFSFGLTDLAQRLNPGWNGAFLPAIMMVIAVEAMATWKIRISLDFYEKILYGLVEWVVLALLLKIILYLFTFPEKIWQDILLWQTNFISFFEGEFLPVLGILILVWLFVLAFLQDLELMQKEPTDFMEEPGKLSNSRQAVRANMITRMMTGGVILVLISILSRLEIKQLWGIQPVPQTSIINALLYFILVLISMTLTQITLLEGKWYRDQVQVKTRIGPKWFRNSIIIVITLALVAFILPSTFSISVFELLTWLFYLISNIVFFILNILVLPISWIFSLLNRNQTIVSETPSQLPPPVFQAGEVPAIPWLELVKTILFWIFFLGIAGFSFFHFFRQNQNLTVRLKFNRVVLWFLSILRGLKSSWIGIKIIILTAKEEIVLFFKPKQANKSERKKWPNFNFLNPRRQILFYYYRLIDAAGKRGFHREINQTPNQFANRLSKEFPQGAAELSEFAEVFNEARYSNHQITSAQSKHIQSLWRNTIRFFRKNSR